MIMNNSAFGEIIFNTGWKTNADITLFGNDYSVIVKVKAYFEKDGISNEQEIAFSNFKTNKSELLKSVENLLSDFADSNASERFVPRMLLFQRDGSYALLLDDNEDEDGGIVACLAPTAEIKSQDEYL